MNGTLFNLWFSSVDAAPNVYRYPTRWFWYIFFDVHRYVEKIWSNLMSIFFRWVEATISKGCPMEWSWVSFLGWTFPPRSLGSVVKHKEKTWWNNNSFWKMNENTEKARYITYTYIYIYVSLKQKQRGLRRFVWVDFLERDQSQENCLRCFRIFSNPTRVIWVPGIYICRLFMFVFLDFVNGDMDKNDIGCRNRNPQIARKTALSWFLLANIYSSKSIFQFLMFGPSMWWLEKDKLRYVYHELV